VYSKKGRDLKDCVLQVEVSGAPGPFWRQIRVPGPTSIKNLGKIIRIAFGWPKKSRCAISFPTAEFQYPFCWAQQDDSVEEIFHTGEVVSLFMLQQGSHPGWAHFVRCIDFRERSDFAITEKGEGEAPPYWVRPIAPIGRLARIVAGGELEASDRGSDGPPFDLVAANERLLNWQGVKKKTIHAQNRCRAMILIDSAPIRSKWENELRELRSRIENLESLIRKFEDLDEPAFRVWLRKRFGPALSKIQQTIERITALRQRLYLISLLDQKYRGRKSKAELLKLALAVESGNAPWPEEPQYNAGKSIDLEILKRMTRGLSPEERAFLEIGIDDLEDEFGALPPEFHDIRDSLKSNGSVSSDSRARCKSIYRKIVLLLHPDRVGELDQHRLQLWYRTQAAYQDSDLVTLEAILDGCAQRVVEKSVNELKEAVLESERQIERLTQRLQQLKQEPAWNFASRKGKKLESRERRVRRELAEQSDELDSELAFLEQEIAQFERPPRMLGRKAKDQMDLFG
jgi:hypothetical protein